MFFFILNPNPGLYFYDNMAGVNVNCVCCDCRVMRRVITLINQLATAKGTTAALQTQAENANQAAKKYMEDNELLKQVSSTGRCRWKD